MYSKHGIEIGTLKDRVKHVLESAFNGKGSSYSPAVLQKAKKRY
jgi:hypothetical protein